jgi:hypothetical protein
MVKIPIKPKELIAFSAEKIPMGAGYRAGVGWMKTSVIYARDTYLFVKSHRGVRKLAHRS